jgi:exopolyphosphatase/guanosine-5'-triphosphate,3'-diphosphate pyrophosphatase
MPDNINTESQIYAALDLGSNSFHILIAKYVQGKLEILDRHKEMVRLAEGLQEDGNLSTKAMNKAFDSLARFSERLRNTPTAQIRVVGTNTLRAAKNSDTFLKQAEHILGTPVHIISGTEEARLIYKGLKGDFFPEFTRLVIDIGGGSTELILGDLKLRTLRSLQMGCVSFSKNFFSGGKLTQTNYNRAVTAARIEVEGHIKAFEKRNWNEVVGSSGTIRSIGAILDALGMTDEHNITAQGLDTLAKKALEFEDITSLDLPALSNDRKAVFVGGLAILHGLFLELGIDRMHVSNYALREGIIFDLLDRKLLKDLRTQTLKRMASRYHIDKAQTKRINKIAKLFIKQNKTHFGQESKLNLQRLDSAIRLHEIGLSLAHDDFHKHGSYILENSDMAGFSKLEQKYLSFLVLNQRRKLNPMPNTYGFAPNWDLVLIMRLACLLNRRRDNDNAPKGIHLLFFPEGASLTLDKDWAKDHPLTMDLLNKEKKHLLQQNYIFDVCETSGA